MYFWVTASSLLYSYPTSCCSVAEIMSVLFFHTMKYRPEDPRNFNSDRFILSKVSCSELDIALYLYVGLFEHHCLFSFSSQGHAAPALYSMWVETGFLKESDLLSLCQVDSALESHPTPVSYAFPQGFTQTP